MSDLSYADRVAADIAARYGVAVQPGAVQLVPQGTSGIPLPVWDGHRLIVPDWKEKRHRMAVNRSREARRAGAASDGAATALREEIAALYAQGLTDAEMAAHMGKSCALIGHHRRFLRLRAIRKALPPPERPQDVRRSSVRKLISQGMDRDQIAALLGVPARVVTSDAKAMGMALTIPARPAPIRPPRVQSVTGARKRKRRGDNSAALARANAARLAMQAEKRADVLRLLAEGVLVAEVAARVGLSERNVRHTDRMHRMATGAATRRQVIAQDVARLAAEGMGRCAIADALGVARRTVNRHLADLGYRVGDLPGDTDALAVSDRRAATEARLRGMVAQRMTRGQIADEMGMSRKRLAICLLGLGIRQGDVAGDDSAPGAGAQKSAAQAALRARVAGLHADGMALADIAAAVGRPPHSVRMLLCFSGIAAGRDSENGPATHRRARIAELAAQGATRREIIADLGIDRHQLAYELRILKLDLPRLKTGHAPRDRVPMPRPGRRSPERAARLSRIRDMAAEGLTRDVMAATLGRSYAQLSKDISDAGVVVPRLDAARIAPNARKRASDARKALVAELRNQGASLRLICAELDLPRSTVCADLTELRREGRLQVKGRMSEGKKRRASDPEYAARIRAMAAAGHTVAVIARQLAFSPGAVAKVLAGRSDDRAAA